jgi:hypothetical protein
MGTFTAIVATMTTAMSLKNLFIDARLLQSKGNTTGEALSGKCCSARSSPFFNGADSQETRRN